MLINYFSKMSMGLVALFLVGGQSAWADPVSGNPLIPGARDSVNQFTTDGGATWADAYIVTPHPSYAVISGTRYINVKSTYGDEPGASVAHYRTIISPCPCEDRKVPVLVSLKVHADNSARAWLNGRPIAAHKDYPLTNDVKTFQNAPEDFITGTGNAPIVPAAGSGFLVLLPGPNKLEFDIANVSGPTAFDYKAIVKCIKKPRRGQHYED